jgi:hypothetical protein
MVQGMLSLADRNRLSLPYKTTNMNNVQRCHNCGRAGHLARACRQRQYRRVNPVQQAARNDVERLQGEADAVAEAAGLPVPGPNAQRHERRNGGGNGPNIIINNIPPQPPRNPAPAVPQLNTVPEFTRAIAGEYKFKPIYSLNFDLHRTISFANGVLLLCWCLWRTTLFRFILNVFGIVMFACWGDPSLDPRVAAQCSHHWNSALEFEFVREFIVMWWDYFLFQWRWGIVHIEIICILYSWYVSRTRLHSIMHVKRDAVQILPQGDVRIHAQSLGDNLYHAMYTKVTVYHPKAIDWYEAFNLVHGLVKREPFKYCYHVEELTVSLELLAELLNPKNTDVDCTLDEAWDRLGFTLKASHNVNINRSSFLTGRDIFDDTRWCAIYFIMSFRENEHRGFRVSPN